MNCPTNSEDCAYFQDNNLQNYCKCQYMMTQFRIERLKVKNNIFISKQGYSFIAYTHKNTDHAYIQRDICIPIAKMHIYSTPTDF